MKAVATVCLAAMFMGATGAAWAADPAAPLRVLVFSGRNNHDWKTTTPELVALLKACGRFAPVDVTDTPEKCDAAMLANYDVIVCNWSAYPETKREWPAETEKAFVDFVSRGGGFVLFHAAACSFHDWPEFQQLIGITWIKDKTNHTSYHEFAVDFVDKEHPIVKGMQPFRIKDELYQSLVQLTPVDFHVVCTSYADPSQKGTGKNEPMVLTTSLGKGRGANIMLGHDVPAMKNAGFRALMQRATEWAATGEVTIGADGK